MLQRKILCLQIRKKKWEKRRKHRKDVRKERYSVSYKNLFPRRSIQNPDTSWANRTDSSHPWLSPDNPDNKRYPERAPGEERLTNAWKFHSHIPFIIQKQCGFLRTEKKKDHFLNHVRVFVMKHISVPRGIRYSSCKICVF